MLTLQRLELEGFGPFLSKQQVTFPNEPGVTVIYGENMRGKTTLLNALRYAFLGLVYSRGMRRRRRNTLVNRDGALEGRNGFSVSLDFTYQGVEYEVSRQCIAAVDEPKNESDYRAEVYLRRGATPLGPQEREQTLKAIFPEEISRFFLFDGELLQEYEELLINESEAGKKISEAIERILGVPILKRGRSHLTTLFEQAETQAAREASRHQSTQAIGNALQNATQLRDQHRQELARKQKDLDLLVEQRINLEELLKSQQRYANAISERDKATARLEETRLEVARLTGDLQRAMSSAWRSLLCETVRSARKAAQERLQTRVQDVAQSLKSDAVNKGVCPVCEQPLSTDCKAALLQAMPSLGVPFDEQAVLGAMTRLADLNRFRDNDNSGEISQISNQLNSLQHEQTVLRESIEDLNTSLIDADQSAIRQSSASYAEVLSRITIIKQGIEQEDAKIVEYDQTIQRLRRSLEATSMPDLIATQKRARVLRESAEVFAEAIDRYKADLRRRVEATASELFRAMTTEKEDYASLAINESYGLAIVHRDGRTEVARSAGAEHVVALALMGALQRNAPLRGPIVMDSPFGRLDEAHRANVVKALPQMASQVILLVHEGEVGRNRMRELLGSSLKREYQLERISARQTIISEVR